MTIDFKSEASSSGWVLGNIRAAASTTVLQFAFGMKGAQSGALVAGNSKDTTDSVINYRVNLKGPNGELWGDTGVSQPFSLPNPHVLSADSTPRVVTPQVGTFVVTTETTSPLPLILKTGESNPITSVNEIVMRLGSDEGFGSSDLTYISSPHFVYTTEAGVAITYSNPGNNLMVNGQKLKDLEYFLFVPASVVGVGFNYIASGDHMVANPVLNDEVNNQGSFVNPTSAWTLNPNWITDDVDNFALFAMIDKLAGTDSSTRHASSRWNSLAQYFQRYFAKFYRAGSTMFNIHDNTLNDYGPIPGGLGNNGHSSFLLIALDDSQGPIELGSQATISVSYDPSGSKFTLTNGVMDVTGASSGAPPLKFLTKVVY